MTRGNTYEHTICLKLFAEYGQCQLTGKMNEVGLLSSSAYWPERESRLKVSNSSAHISPNHPPTQLTQTTHMHPHVNTGTHFRGRYLE